MLDSLTSLPHLQGFQVFLLASEVCQRDGKPSASVSPQIQVCPQGAESRPQDFEEGGEEEKGEGETSHS